MSYLTASRKIEHNEKTFKNFTSVFSYFNAFLYFPENSDPKWVKQVKLFFNLKKAHSNSPGSIIICKVSSFKLLLKKLCGNCGFPQNFHIGKLDEITVFYAVYKHLFEMPLK